jgi:ROK family
LPPDPLPSTVRSLPHGARKLRCARADDYNVELRDDGGFFGDRANKKVFQAMLDRWRQALGGADPLRDMPTEELYKERQKLETILVRGNPLAAGVLLGAIEDFSCSLADVIAQFLELPAWRDTQRIVIGGGFREGRIGELAIGRTAVLLRQEGRPIEIVPIRHHPDAAGLLGSVELAPEPVLSRFDGILAVDIGGTNIRAGIVKLEAETAPGKIWKSDRWRHADDEPRRDEAIEELIGMLRRLIAAAQEGSFRLAPFIGIACPGIIRPDGTIERGAQNLPGDWESENFNLSDRILGALPRIDGEDTLVTMHNDAVVQGLSEACRMHDVAQWGVLTVGTGLGNAHFTRHRQTA